MAAGYSPKRARITGSELLRNRNIHGEINRIFEAAGVTPENLAKGVHEALDATEIKAFLHQKTGEIVYAKPVIDHKIRLKAARLAGELMGLFAPKEINVKVSLLAERIQAARRREAERTVQGVRVEEGENNTQEAGQSSGAPQAEEKAKEV